MRTRVPYVRLLSDYRPKHVRNNYHCGRCRISSAGSPTCTSSVAYLPTATSIFMEPCISSPRLCAHYLTGSGHRLHPVPAPPNRCSCPRTILFSHIANVNACGLSSLSHQRRRRLHDYRGMHDGIVGGRIVRLCREARCGWSELDPALCRSVFLVGIFRDKVNASLDSG